MKRALVLGGLLLCGTALAQIVYDNGSPPDPAIGAAGSDINQDTETLDDFVLASDVVLREVHWWGMCSDTAGAITTCLPGDLDFTIRIYEDVTGVPAALPLHEFSPGNPGCINTGQTQSSGGTDRDIFECRATIPDTLRCRNLLALRVQRLPRGDPGRRRLELESFGTLHGEPSLPAAV